MRCFIAVDLDRGLAGEIEKVQREIMNLGVGVKFVEPENLHFTLKFLGEVSEDEIGVIKNSIERGLGCANRFRIGISGMGYFGSQKHIRTLWMGVKEGKDEFVKLVDNVNRGLSIGEDGKNVHLTIGRVKSCKNEELLLNFINEHKDVNIGEMDVKDVKLKSSVLTSGGPLYSDLALFRLGGKDERGQTD